MKVYQAKLFVVLFLAALVASSCEHIAKTAETDAKPAVETEAKKDEGRTYSGYGGGFGSADGFGSARPGLGGGVETTPLEQVEEDPSLGNIWCSVDFVELKRTDFLELQKRLGFSLDPTIGKAVLDGAEKEKLMTLLDSTPSVDFQSSAAVLTLAGQTAQMQIVKEIRYLTGFKVEADSKKGKGEETEKKDPEIMDESFETRETGTLLTVTPRCRKTAS